jgi:hypothetical protein
MAMAPEPTGARGAPQHSWYAYAAWVSLIMPTIAAVVMMFLQPMEQVGPPMGVYWTMFACSIVSLVAGCLAISGIGRHLDWNILTPAILGILFSAILGYLCLGFGVLSADPPNWNQMRHTQATAPAARHG